MFWRYGSRRHAHASCDSCRRQSSIHHVQGILKAMCNKQAASMRQTMQENDHDKAPESSECCDFRSSFQSPRLSRECLKFGFLWSWLWLWWFGSSLHHIRCLRKMPTHKFSLDIFDYVQKASQRTACYADIQAPTDAHCELLLS